MQTSKTSRVHADACIAAMDRLEVDFTQLWPLSRHWEWADTMECTKKIKAFVEGRLKLRRADVVAPGFAARVDEVFQERGIVNLAPHRRVEAYRKEELWGKYRAAAWPEPHTPYLIQMRPGPFILLSNWQAGLHMLRDMAGRGHYRTEDGRRIDVTLLYEGQIVGVPCRVILDCDAYVSQFGERMTREALEASVRRVPQRLVERLTQLGALRRQDSVRFWVKNKSRGDKVSFHFVSNILMDPTVDGKNALAQVFIEPFAELRREMKRLKKTLEYALDKDSGACPPELHVDIATIKGKHQFSCAFSRKPGERPCVFEGQQVVSDGGRQTRFERSRWADEPNEPAHPAALSTLFYLGFAHWLPDMVTLDKSFRVFTSAETGEVQTSSFYSL